MPILRRFGFILSAAVLAHLLAAGTAAAQTPDATISVQPGARVQVAYSMHFNYRNCQAASVPTVNVLQLPAKGEVEVVREMAPLRSTQSDRGKACIGTMMRAAVVYYTARPGEAGSDVFSYRVTFPRSCRDCRNFTRTIAVAIGSPSAPPATPPGEGAGSPSGSGTRITN